MFFVFYLIIKRLKGPKGLKGYGLLLLALEDTSLLLYFCVPPCIVGIVSVVGFCVPHRLVGFVGFCSPPRLVDLFGIVALSGILFDHSIGLIIDSINAISSSVKPYLAYSSSSVQGLEKSWRGTNEYVL